MAQFQTSNPFVGVDLTPPPPEIYDASAKQDIKAPRRRHPLFYSITLQSWADLLLAIAFGIVWFIIGEENPRIRPVRPWDATLSYPATTSDTVPGWVCIVVPLAMLILSVLLGELLATYRNRGSASVKGTLLLNVLHFILQGIYAYVFAMMVCEAIKDAVGMPRPQFLARCQPTPASSLFPPALTANALSDTVECTNTNAAYMTDARRSFPSGHSTSNAVMSSYLIVYMLSLQSRHYVHRAFSFVQQMLGDLVQGVGLLWMMCVFAWPWFVACTRIIDNMHATADVTAGLFLGVSVGAVFGGRAVLRGNRMMMKLTELIEQGITTTQARDEKRSASSNNAKFSLGTALKIQTWGDIVFLICVGLALAILYWKATPYQRQIFIYDATISYSDLSGSTIPSWACFLVPFLLLLINVSVVELWLRNRHGSTLATAYFIHFVLQGIYCYLFTLLIAQITNFIVGYPRPEFLSRCQPANPTFPNAFSNGPPVAITCTNPNTSYVLDGLKSFPSGHAASSAVENAYLTVYLLWALYTRPRKQFLDVTTRWRFFLYDLFHTAALTWILAIFAWTWFVCASRVINNEHSIADVTSGMVLGFVVGAVFGARAVLRSKVVVVDLALLRDM